MRVWLLFFWHSRVVVANVCKLSVFFVISSFPKVSYFVISTYKTSLAQQQLQ